MVVEAGTVAVAVDVDVDAAVVVSLDVAPDPFGWLKQYSTACSKESGGERDTASCANSAEKPMLIICIMSSLSSGVNKRGMGAEGVDDVEGALVV